MATNTVLQYKWDHLLKQEDDDHEKHVEQAEEDDEDEDDDDDDEEEEALSLCDLPVTLINDKDQDRSRKQDTQLGETEEQEEEQEQDFDFNSWGGGLFSQEPQMCVADEVFFQGQILPLRHSFSSEPSLFKIKGSQMQHDGTNKQFNRCELRSESMDHASTSEFGSNSSSRSCSLRSQNSSSSTSSTTAPPIRVSNPKIRNQFHTIPSPKPQLRQSRSGTRQTIFSFGNQGRKSSSSPWEFLRLGVAPAPEMLGLQDLKFRNSNANRNSVSRNSSSSSNNSTDCSNTKTISSFKKSNSKNKSGGNDGDKGNNHVLKQFVGKGGGLLSGCSCSVDSVVAQLDTVMIKSTNTKPESVAATTTHAMKEKVAVAKLNKEHQNKKKKSINNNNNNVRQKQKAKKVMSRRRTFEWLKELHANKHREDEEALLSNT